MRISDITSVMNITRPEARRHLSRLREVGLIHRDYNGYYHLTSLCKASLLLFEELIFLSRHTDYFKTHSISQLPVSFVKQIGELGESKRLDTPLDFIRYTENLIRESKEYVWLIAEQFPVHLISTIVEALKRGVSFKVIELKERTLNPNFDALTSSETEALNHTLSTSLFQQRMLDKINLFMLISDNRCIITFPTIDNKIDYTGFTATNKDALKLCSDLFQDYWEKSEKRTPSSTTELKRTPISDGEKGRIVVKGTYRPDVDAQAIQDALDHYDEVILSGTFNVGNSTFLINRSIALRGEGRDNDVPSARIRKSGWQFPCQNQEFLIIVDGDGIDVTIENIRFSDFNGTCIWNCQGNSAKILNNLFSLSSGFGRGTNVGNWGDLVNPISSGGPSRGLGGFPDGVLIEGNYIDFADIRPFGGFIERTGEENNPDYRPNLAEHESYIGIGILLNRNLGKVVVRNNVICNANSKGILIADNLETAEFHIYNNKIISEIYGSYAYNNPNAGFGILAQNSMNVPHKGSKVKIYDNEIHCSKLNYCGIGVLGPSTINENSGKLEECIIYNNRIHLEDGSVGVYVRKSDFTEITNNTISGKAYYGFQVSGRNERNGLDLGAYSNVIENNDLSELEIKPPDEYSDSHVDGRMFTGSEGESETSHVWLNKYSKDNIIKVKAGERVIDEGEDNSILLQDTPDK